jgi:hypothetical protein
MKLKKKWGMVLLFAGFTLWLIHMFVFAGGIKLWP